MMAFRKETEAASQRLYSSSSTKFHDDIFQHRLICTSVTDLDRVCNVKALALEDLKCPCENINEIPLNSRVNAAEKDVHVGRYVKHCVPNSTQDLNLSVSVDSELHSLQRLKPFMKSLDNRPDVVLLKDDLPLLIVEVQSSPYINSVCKTVVDLIDQLRLLRNLNPRIAKCTGFTFPDYNKKECVAKVEVEWKELSFHICFTPLITPKAVEDEVITAIQEQLCASFIDKPCDFFIPLSDDDMALVKAKITDDHKCTIHQVHSRQSIVLECGQFFWKHNPSLVANLKLHELNCTNVLPMRFVTIGIKKLPFFGVPTHLPPLSRQDAYVCLYSFVTNVGKVLRELHGVDEIAHLDVRLENICFKLPDSVVMIDFDRYESADAQPNCFGYTDSVMYKAGNGWKNKQLDWKQFGLMIGWIIHGYKKYHSMEVETLLRDSSDDDFLYDLLVEGKYDEEKLKNSTLSQYQTKSLKDVLQDRHSALNS